MSEQAVGTANASLKQANIERFNQEAHHWEEKAYIRDWAQRMAQQIASVTDLEGRACLEFGCGTGALSEMLAPKARDVYGVDVSPAMVARFNAKSIPNMHGVCLDVTDEAAMEAAAAASQLPRSFDVICAHMVMHHVDEVAAVLRALGRLLAPGAKLLVSDLAATPQSVRFHAAHAHHTVSHIGGFSEQQLAAYAADAGLQLAAWRDAAVTVRKQVERVGDEGGGGPEEMEFPLFLAVLQRA